MQTVQVPQWELVIFTCEWYHIGSFPSAQNHIVAYLLENHADLQYVVSSVSDTFQTDGQGIVSYRGKDVKALAWTERRALFYFIFSNHQSDEKPPWWSVF